MSLEPKQTNVLLAMDDCSLWYSGDLNGERTARSLVALGYAYCHGPAKYPGGRGSYYRITPKGRAYLKVRRMRRKKENLR